MRVVVDANVVLSAMLRDGAVRHALASTDAHLFAPAFLKQELGKHLGTMARRAGVKKADAQAALEGLLADVIWVGEEAIERSWKQAHRALAKTDPKDVPYLAAALAVHADAIWSFDTDFDAQDLIPRITRPARRS